MLTHIHIQNFVIVKSLTVDFGKGLQVLTGETGAGKSIWVDAIQIALGGRADSRVIFDGEATCAITLCFNLTEKSNAKAWLEAHDIPTADECIIRRTLHIEKPSRTTLNGTPMPQHQIRDFASLLINIHSQHQHQALLTKQYQTHLLDCFTKNSALLAEVKANYQNYKTAETALDQLKAQSQNKEADLTLWRYQLDELKKLSLEEKEYETLFSTYQHLHHDKEIAGAITQAEQILCSDYAPSVIDQLNQAKQQMTAPSIKNETLINVCTLLDESMVLIEEAYDTLNKYHQNNEYHFDDLPQIEARMSRIQDTARKHNTTPEQLYLTHQSLEDKINQLTALDDNMTHLEHQLEQMKTLYQASAKQLTQARKCAAKHFAKAMTQWMQKLGMPDSELAVSISTNAKTISETGQDHIIWETSLNKGQSRQPMAQVASGGELSRISLIAEILTTQAKTMPTLIFDEVDVGIGGETAQTIGKLLKQLAKDTQVLCVTHLPQVAAFGHAHFKAEKKVIGNQTQTFIVTLDKDARAQELARMLSGSQITKNSLSHAKELLKESQ